MLVAACSTKRRFEELLRQEMRHKLCMGQVYVSLQEIAALLEKAIVEVLTPDLFQRSMESVGYYLDSNGDLQYDPLRVLNAK